MKCEWCGEKMYSLEINYRDGDKTTKKVIGKICAICERPRHNTPFWTKFNEYKQSVKRQKENIRGARVTPRMIAKTICGRCRSTKLRFRKLKVKPGETQSYQATCRKCGFDWRQAWKNYTDLERLGWAPKRIIT